MPRGIAALLMRSGCNPRCLEGLLQDGRPYDNATVPGAGLGTPAGVLDALLHKRLADARRAAREKGARDVDIDLLSTRDSRCCRRRFRSKSSQPLTAFHLRRSRASPPT